MKKCLSILLTLVMLVSVIPFSCVTVYAESSDVCTEHSFGEWELVRIVSCTNAGTREREVRKCLNCGKKEYRYTGRFIEHDWIDWVVAREATCTLYGEEYRYCNICGDEVYRFPEATGHNYEAVVVNPTCTEPGYTEYICKCGDTYTDNFIEATGHNYDVVVVNQTCTEEGYTEYRCSCGDTYTDNFIEATGHNKNAEGICENCKENLNPSPEQDVPSVENNIYKIFIDLIYLIMEFFVGLG